MSASTTMLQGPEYPPLSGEPPKQLVILLHGVGADGADLIGLAPLFADALPAAQFLSPNAPFPCDMAPFGFQWFSLQDREPEAMLRGVRAVEPVINNCIDTQLARFGLSESQLAIIGFSQGTMTALHTLPRRAKACAGIVGYSGALLGEDLLNKEAASKPPVCLIHGTADSIVPFAAMGRAQNALLAAGITVETHARPGLPHSIDPEGISLAISFLQRCVKAA